MVGTQEPLGVSDHPLQQRQCPGHLTGRAVGPGEVVLRRQGMGVLGAQRPFLGGQRLLILPDGQPHLAGVLIGGGQVGPEREGDLMLVTQRPLGVGHRSLQ
jgi:hypothetical protein